MLKGIYKTLLSRLNKFALGRQLLSLKFGKNLGSIFQSIVSEEGMTMQKITGLKKVGILIGVLGFLVNLNFFNLAVAQEESEPAPCPKPHIKLIKPNLAKAGQQIIIRGYRFGPEEKKGEVIPPPGLNGKIISWRYSRITVEVPSGAKTGKVVVRTKCAESNGEFFKVVE